MKIAVLISYTPMVNDKCRSEKTDTSDILSG